MSGRQLFTIDSFRDTGRPLLSVLADPESVFIQALGSFSHRSLYTNIVNDRSAVYYTTAISRTDPFTHMDKLNLHYLEGYEPVLLDPDAPLGLRDEKDLPSFYQRFSGSTRTWLKRAPLVLALVVIIPIASVAFVINSSIQTLRSRRRIQFHEGKHETFGRYRIPYLIRDVRQAVEDAFENVNSAQDQEYLLDGTEELAEVAKDTHNISSESLPLDRSIPEAEKTETAALVKTSTKDRQPEFPTLALTPEQFAMIRTLDSVGFRKHPVHIHNTSHSHAAIIVRHPRGAFDEGKIVVKHWLEEFRV